MIPALSICIPTRNRAKLLARSLETALRQSIDLPVEICVSNNASSDSTADLLASLAASHSQLRYEDRAQNIGIDRNILAAVRMAHGRYVLPIGDDEMLVPDAVSCILAALAQHPDLLILNGRYEESGAFLSPRLPKNLSGRTITRLSEAFVLLWDKMPLGGFVAPRGYAAPQFADHYLGTHHAYSGAVWDCLLAGFNYTGHLAIVVMEEPLIEFHRLEKAWAPDAAAIHFEQIPRWFDLLPGYYTAVAQAGLRAYCSRCTALGKLIRLRAAGQLNRTNVAVWFRNFGFCARLRAQGTAFLPVSAAAAALRLSRAVRPQAPKPSQNILGPVTDKSVPKAV